MLERILLGSFALLMAVPAGALTLGAGILLDPASREAFGRLGLAGLLMGLSDLAAGLPPDVAAMALVALVRALALLLVLPPALTALAGETLGLRASLWYGGACGVLTAALPWLARGAVRPPESAAAAEARLSAILLLAGAVSGLVYWLIAGRTAGPRGHR